jgi:hypothetical protein
VFKRVTPSTLAQRIISVINSEREYQDLRDAYTAIIHDQMLQLSPNYEILLDRIQQLGIQAREKAADKRLELFEVLDSEIDDSQNMALKEVGKR